MRFLFLISIGPIQTFIASARRTRDLWFGSRLLSELSKEVATKIAMTYGYQALIFPAPDLKQHADMTVANKILALIEVTEKNEVRELGKNIKVEIGGYVMARIEEAFTRIEKNHPPELINKNDAIAQVKDLVELSWVALPYEGDYQATRTELERLLAARKQTRNFGAVTWGGSARKSSIDGQLESVIPEDYYPRYKNDPRGKELIEKLYRYFHAGPAEHLSGVDLLKRLGEFPGESEESRFVSTSHIAALPYLARVRSLFLATDPIQQGELIEAWNAVRGEAHKLGQATVEQIPADRQKDLWHPVLQQFDGGMLYEERYRQDVSANTDLRGISEKLQAFFKQVNYVLKAQAGEAEAAKILPDGYYAILIADGDGMGAAIDHLAQEGPQAHQRLSSQLAEFAGGVKALVEGKYQGTLVYAGGDDVVAFLPLHTALDCALALSRLFDEQMRAFKDRDRNSPTLSAGIAVVHHLEMLSSALNHARRAERLAKHVPGKNALAISVCKRSGEIYNVAGKTTLLFERLHRLFDMYRGGILARGTPYEIRASIQRLTEVGAPSDEQLLTVMWLEIKRIFKRKLKNPQARNAGQEFQDYVKQLFESLDPKSQTSSQNAPATLADLENFTNALIVAQELVAALELAEGPALNRKEIR